MRQAERKRGYDDGCAVAHALDIVGERWALLVIRELLIGPKRFGGLRASLPGISANVLTQRLEALEAAALVQRRRLPPPASSWVYELTEWGMESEELFKVIGRWAARSPLHGHNAPMSVASVVLSMRTMFSPAAANGLEAMLGLVFGEEVFRAVVTRTGLTIDRGAIDEVDVVITGNQNALALALYMGTPLEELEASGALAITGERRLAERFVRLFPLPPTAPAKAAKAPPLQEMGGGGGGSSGRRARGWSPPQPLP